MDDGRNLLTHSRMASAKTCLRKHWYEYELGIRADRDGQPLRMGGAYHLGLEELGKGHDLHAAICAVRMNYANVPEWVRDIDDWRTEEETVVRMICGYVWRWQEQEGGLFGGEVVATELPFEIPIVNPETGRSTPTFKLAGKIDKIIRLPDTRLAVGEHKSTGQSSIEPDNDYWKRLRMDHQITIYLHAARTLGYDVKTVLYDVAKKPGIKRGVIPLLDINGLKIVLNADDNRVLTKQGKPRQTGDKDKGYVLQTRPETPAEFGERFNADIAARPDWYFQRQEIARTEGEIEEFRHELWQTQQLLRDCQRNGRWFRNTGACLSPFRCPYFPCNMLDIDTVPEGFVQLNYVHPELKEPCHEPTESTPVAAAAEGWR